MPFARKARRRVLAISQPLRHTDMLERITVRPDVHFGKPCIEGTRIPVQAVVELIAEGLSFEQVIKDYYPDINKEDIRACLRYAAALVAAEDIDLASIPS
jgi:uncharacterized protein (DUF433 family)